SSCALCTGARAEHRCTAHSCHEAVGTAGLLSPGGQGRRHRAPCSLTRTCTCTCTRSSPAWLECVPLDRTWRGRGNCALSTGAGAEHRCTAHNCHESPPIQGRGCPRDDAPARLAEALWSASRRCCGEARQGHWTCPVGALNRFRVGHAELPRGAVAHPWDARAALRLDTSCTRCDALKRINIEALQLSDAAEREQP